MSEGFVVLPRLSCRISRRPHWCMSPRCRWSPPPTPCTPMLCSGPWRLPGWPRRGHQSSETGRRRVRESTGRLRGPRCELTPALRPGRCAEGQTDGRARCTAAAESRLETREYFRHLSTAARCQTAPTTVNVAGEWQRYTRLRFYVAVK